MSIVPAVHTSRHSTNWLSASTRSSSPSTPSGIRSAMVSCDRPVRRSLGGGGSSPRRSPSFWSVAISNGWYSNKKRGLRARAQPLTPEGSAAPPRPPSAREARKRWAALIKQVYETDPLSCPKCRSEMKIIAFIACLPKPRRRQERRQTQLVEKILRSRPAGGTVYGRRHPPGTHLQSPRQKALRLRSRHEKGPIGHHLPIANIGIRPTELL